ncbi:MAG TPA: FAD-dependent oxidoreductase [Actinophytocola sp.]|jgi:NADPH-dependent 2,4-dienoyl-CoA reductase/sulfur reductase-like enzyme|nr:FAD-dependent oxidoreductase [Actinophytocola sp.]
MADKGERIVVVGTGGAGLRAAERVRELDFAGELVIIGEEPYRPYHRPLLSKQVLTGAIRPRDVQLPTHSDLGAVWRPKTRVSRLDPEEHVVHLPGGEEIDYDGLIVATGMQPAHLPGAPRHDPRVHVLRNISDAVAVQKLLASGKGRVALIGGGFLAGEVASAARELGRDTTIIIREPAMLENVPGFDVSETVTALQEANGVRLVTDATVSHWHTDSSGGVTMHLSTGEVVVADCVVLCVGGVPATDWLRGSGLLVDDGVLCGPTTHALGVEDVVAAGDVARWPNLRFDTVPRRVEHWMNAVEMGRAAADALLAGRDAAVPFTPLPKFWSEQHGVRIQGAGLPALAQETVELTEAVPIGSKITGYVAGGSLIGILAWDSPRGMQHYNYELHRQTTEAMRRRMAETPREQPAPAVQVRDTQRPPARPLPPPRPEHVPAAMPALAPTGARRVPVRPPLPRAAMGDQPSVPSMPPAHPSIPSMPPVNPSLRSNPGMPPVDPSVPFMPTAQASIPSMPPARRSNPGMPPVNPAQRSSAGMPPVNPSLRSSPSMPPVNPSLRSSPGMPPVNPAQRSSPGMPPAQLSSPGMPPVGHPAQRSNTRMPPVGHPAQRSNPGMPPAGHPAQRSNTRMPPAQQSSRGMPPAQQSSPGMPPARPGADPRSAPTQASPTVPVPGNGQKPVNPGQYSPPMSGSADPADPAIMELPPIDAWRQAS